MRAHRGCSRRGTRGARVRRVGWAIGRVRTVFTPWAIRAGKEGAGDAADELVHGHGGVAGRWRWMVRWNGAEGRRGRRGRGVGMIARRATRRGAVHLFQKSVRLWGCLPTSPITITCETRSAFVRAPTFVNLLLEVMGSGEGGKVVEVSLGA